MFFKNLESLRGVAALMVAVGHCMLVFQVDGIAELWPTALSDTAGWQSAFMRALLIPFNGAAAVVIFFVLSGYVLGLSLDRNQRRLRGIFDFYLKRVFRLYPAHLVVLAAIVLALVFLYDYQLFEASSAWFAKWYQDTPDAGAVLDNALLKHVGLNHIAWTLQVELAGSLFLPFAWWLCRRLNVWLNVLVLAALVVLSWHSRSVLLIFLYCFYAGLMLPQWVALLGGALTGRSGRVLLGLGLGVMLLAHTLTGSDELLLPTLLETLGGVLTIAYLLHPGNTDSRLNRLLSLDRVNQLGRYSYSFYLLHFAVLYATATLMFLLVPATWLMTTPVVFSLALIVLTVPPTFALSGWLYTYVEVPMMGVGKRLTGTAGAKPPEAGQTPKGQI